MRSTDYDDYDYAQYIMDEEVVRHQRDRDIADDMAYDAMVDEEVMQKLSRDKFDIQGG